MSRTIRAAIECRVRACDRGIEAGFMPVVQGRWPQDYERCADALSLTIDRAPLIGVGSMCRRPIHGPEGLVAVVDHLDQILPRRSEEHTSELQSLMRISYAVFCLKKKKI